MHGTKIEGSVHLSLEPHFQVLSIYREWAKNARIRSFFEVQMKDGEEAKDKNRRADAVKRKQAPETFVLLVIAVYSCGKIECPIQGLEACPSFEMKVYFKNRQK